MFVSFLNKIISQTKQCSGGTDAVVRWSLSRELYQYFNSTRWQMHINKPYTPSFKSYTAHENVQDKSKCHEVGFHANESMQIKYYVVNRTFEYGM